MGGAMERRGGQRLKAEKRQSRKSSGAAKGRTRTGRERGLRQQHVRGEVEIERQKSIRRAVVALPLLWYGVARFYCYCLRLLLLRGAAYGQDALLVTPVTSLQLTQGVS